MNTNSKGSHSPNMSCKTGRKGTKSSNRDHDLRIEGLKSSIITVYGDALDKIGFSITEKANRSAQTRLGKTLKSLENMENREELLYRKQKYEVQMNLDRLHQQQISARREHIKKASSLDSLDDTEGSSYSRRLSPTSSIEGYNHFTGHRSSAEGVHCLTENQHKNKTGARNKLYPNGSPKLVPRSFRSLCRETSSSCERLDISRSKTNGVIQQSNPLESTHSMLRPATSNVFHDRNHLHVVRPATCSTHHISDANFEQNKISISSYPTSQSNELLVENSSSSKISFPKLNTKAHFLVQSHNTHQNKYISKTPEPHRKNLHLQFSHCPETSIRHGSIQSDLSPQIGRKSIPVYDHGDWLPPSKEEMLQMLELQKEEIQERVNEFLAKQNPK